MRMKATVAVSLGVAASAIGACGGGSSGISSKFRSAYVAGCAKTQSQEGCECLYNQLTEKQGFNTEQKLTDVSKRVAEAVQKGDRSAFPKEFIASATACKSKISPSGG